MGETTYQLAVAGMTCAHCEQTITQALTEAGATHVQASFRAGTVTFQAPGNSPPALFRAAVRDAGYRPKGLTVLDRAGADQPSPGATDTAAHPAGVYDLAVIGSGGAAMAAAITAVGEGARVVMIERGTLGGTCVNIGCVPSKTLLRGSEIYAQAGHHPFAGLATAAGAVDLVALVGQKDELVARLRQEKYANLIVEYGWELVRGTARFVDAQTLQVDGRTIRAGQYLIATGADPAVPPIPGLAAAGYLTSTSALALTTLPASLLVIGAGYIALELGQYFQQLGTRVTIAQRGAHLLPQYEPEIGQVLAEQLAAQGITVLTGTHIERVEAAPTGRRVYLTVAGQAQVQEATQILVATGRQPNTAALNLAAAGVELDGRGAIRVDDHLHTTNRRIWAAGDATLGPQFVYVAAYEGKLAAQNALTDAGRRVDFTALPQVVFTHPQIAVVGLTEAAAQAQGRAVRTAVLPLADVPRAQVNHDPAGVIKLVADAASGQILGVHLLAENAGEVIYAATLAVKHGLTITDLVESFAPYLTMAESLKLGAQSFGRDVQKLSCCAA